MNTHITKKIIDKLEKSNITTGLSFHVEIFKDDDNMWNLYVTGEDTNIFKNEECGLYEYDEDLPLFILNLLEEHLNK